MTVRNLAGQPLCETQIDDRVEASENEAGRDPIRFFAYGPIGRTSSLIAQASVSAVAALNAFSRIVGFEAAGIRDAGKTLNRA